MNILICNQICSLINSVDICILKGFETVDIKTAIHCFVILLISIAGKRLCCVFLDNSPSMLLHQKTAETSGGFNITHARIESCP